ncbi:MAG: 50S ribosomal protein L21 [Candidatus Omnitrophota bacterium]|jgi:large subunit ribosomal protein L21|nr:MAG: 50S ribosomal protein L21 [Candidatus Omnitrophota bacterium]
MYAVIEVGAKQYVVKKDDIIDVEKQDAQKNKELLLDKVLLTADSENILIGQPYLKNAIVHASVLDQVKSDKKISFKYRRRKSSHWTKGHRQQLTRIKIKDIKVGK